MFCTSPVWVPVCELGRKLIQHILSLQASPGKLLPTVGPKSISNQSINNSCSEKNFVGKINNLGNHTAAIEGLVSSPFSGWVTSAPNIMVGMSLTNGILQLIASRRTVFLPPICAARIGQKSRFSYLEPTIQINTVRRVVILTPTTTVVYTSRVTTGKQIEGMHDHSQTSDITSCVW